MGNINIDTKLGIIVNHFSDNLKTGKPMWYDRLLRYISDVERARPGMIGDELHMPNGIGVATVYSTGRGATKIVKAVRDEFADRSIWTGPRVESSNAESSLFLVKAGTETLSEIKKACEKACGSAWEQIVFAQLLPDVMRCKACGKYVFRTHSKMKYCCKSCRRHAEKIRNGAGRRSK